MHPLFPLLPPLFCFGASLPTSVLREDLHEPQQHGEPAPLPTGRRAGSPGGQQRRHARVSRVPRPHPQGEAAAGDGGVRAQTHPDTQTPTYMCLLVPFWLQSDDEHFHTKLAVMLLDAVKRTRLKVRASVSFTCHARGLPQARLLLMPLHALHLLPSIQISHCFFFVVVAAAPTEREQPPRPGTR